MCAANIEFKARCPDPQRVRQRLADLGIPLARDMRQRDTYFVVPCGRLKLRRIDDSEAELIQYQRADRAAARQSSYQLVPVPEPDPLERALARALGVRVVVDKRRTLYLWGRTRVHLDQVRGLGSFLELETVVTDQSLEEARAECEAVRRELGVEEGELLSGSYADLLLELAG